MVKTVRWRPPKQAYNISVLQQQSSVREERVPIIDVPDGETLAMVLPVASGMGTAISQENSFKLQDILDEQKRKNKEKMHAFIEMSRIKRMKKQTQNKQQLIDIKKIGGVDN